MAAFAFIGDEAGIAVYGLRFHHGEPVEVADDAVMAKLRHMRYPNGAPYFVESFDGVQVLDAVEPKKRGRPRKAE